ncbi:MAG: Txe/YoeB family addiction module toxin [Thermoanaerobaculia bacterium]|nr:Txe/YoeB family addiction module toxin [Thermoanaerobaculia bacterium]MBP9822858.1 Txe/YoeB family addiction module toxin [Thermoanaerobaculia bacterium]
MKAGSGRVKAAEPPPGAWEVVFTRQAVRDAKKLSQSGLKDRAENLLAVIREDPFQSPPHFEKLVGDLAGAFSRRINIQHRLVYEVFPELRTVRVLRMWTHYE